MQSRLIVNPSFRAHEWNMLSTLQYLANLVMQDTYILLAHHTLRLDITAMHVNNFTCFSFPLPHPC